MATNSVKRPDLMSIRSWLKLAALVLIVLSGISCLMLYQLGTNVQLHTAGIGHSSRMQMINAELARNINRAWLGIDYGEATSAAAALAELRRQKDALRELIDDLAMTPDTDFSKFISDNRDDWKQLYSNLSRFMQVAQRHVMITKTSAGAAAQLAGPTIMPFDRSLLQMLTDDLATSIANSRSLSAQSEANLRWILVLVCIATLAMTAVTLAAGLIFLLFISHRIGTRASDLSNRLLHYTGGAYETPKQKRQADEFGTIEAQIDECAGKVHRREKEVALEHKATLTQLRERTEQLTKRSEAHRASGRALVRFLTDVSHDLRTPLAIMVGESDVLLQSQSTSIGDYRDTVSRMLEQTRYLGALVDQLLFTARSQVVSAAPLELESIDVSELVRNTCRDIKTLADNESISIQVTGNPESCVVLGDRVRLREMMLTILDNAIEYSTPHSTVTASMVEEASNLVVRVTDTGIGIPASEMPMIFRRFYRAQNAVDSNAQGTGIGLAVAKGIVESHNGTIEIDSKENAGTTVILALPLVESSQVTPEAV